MALSTVGVTWQVVPSNVRQFVAVPVAAQPSFGSCGCGQGPGTAAAFHHKLQSLAT